MTHKAWPAHVALYGNLAIKRLYCSKCRTYAFFIDGELRCCGSRPEDEEARSVKQICQPELKRRTPKQGMKQLILTQQANCCFYCERQFGATVYRGVRVIILRYEWDHVVPYAYAQNNSTDNFVAACQVCNAIKYSHMFETIEKAKVYLNAEWSKRKYTDLPPMREL